MSLKVNVIKKLRLSFNEKLKTGEDIKFCKDVRSKGYNILKIPNTNVHHMDRENFKEVFEHHVIGENINFILLINLIFEIR